MPPPPHCHSDRCLNVIPSAFSMSFRAKPHCHSEHILNVIPSAAEESPATAHRRTTSIPRHSDPLRHSEPLRHSRPLCHSGESRRFSGRNAHPEVWGTSIQKGRADVMPPSPHCHSEPPRHSERSRTVIPADASMSFRAQPRNLQRRRRTPSIPHNPSP